MRCCYDPNNEGLHCGGLSSDRITGLLTASVLIWYLPVNRAVKIWPQTFWVALNTISHRHEIPP